MKRTDGPINPEEWNSLSQEIQQHFNYYYKKIQEAKKNGKLVNQEMPEWEIEQEYYKEQVK